MPDELRLPAIEVKQSPGRTIYTFSVDGKLVSRFATISRIRRADDGTLVGYQRPEVLSHIAEIRDYLESESPMVPNAVVIAFDSRVRFEPTRGPRADYAQTGELVIPVGDFAPEDCPGFVVDGQQRLAAIRDSRLESFPVCVSAFITDDLKEQTEQFILVNSTKPLPKGLIYELLPSTEAHLPSLLSRRRLPAILLTELNSREQSPLRGMIQTATTPHGVIKDNSILKMIEYSLSDGLLHRLRQSQGDIVDTDELLGPLFAFWGAVQAVFPSDWGKPPKKSRLMHGAGVVSLGFLMDAIADRHRKSKFPTQRQFEKDLEVLAPVCRWSDGFWDFGPGMQRKWSEVQNTSKDVQVLSNYLLIQYKNLVWSRADDRIKQLRLSE